MNLTFRNVNLTAAITISMVVHTTALTVPWLSMQQEIKDIERKQRPALYFELVEQTPVDQIKEAQDTPYIDESARDASGKELADNATYRPNMQGNTRAKVLKTAEKKSDLDNAYEKVVADHLSQKVVTEKIQQSEKVTPTNEERDRIFNSMAPPSVDELGVLAFATQTHLLAPYLKDVKKKIFDNWYEMLKEQKSKFIGSRVTVAFRIQMDGSVTALQVVKGESPELYENLCLVAIQKAVPFDPAPIEIPEFLKDRSVPVQFTFYYD